ncbi:FtsB family cell division protein [Halovulum sp. GXIMD14793]
MYADQTPRSGLFGAAFAIFVIAMICYFTYAAIQGNYGLFRLIQVEAQEEMLEQDLAVLRAERAVIANKARRLSTDYLDLDLLDEQARKVLGLARGDEIIIR